jgi:hypothetical protein
MQGYHALCLLEDQSNGTIYKWSQTLHGYSNPLEYIDMQLLYNTIPITSDKIISPSDAAANSNNNHGADCQPSSHKD